MAPRKILLHLIEKEYDDEGMSFCEIDVDVTIYGLATEGIEVGEQDRFHILLDNGKMVKFSFTLTNDAAVVREKIALPNDVEIVDFAIFIDNCDPNCSGCVSYRYDPTPPGENMPLHTGDKLTIALNQSATFFVEKEECGNITSNYYAKIEVESGKSRYAGIGLNYFGARYYDAEVGVWVSTDPLEQFWNSYSYTGGNPINLVDPDGTTTVLNHDGSVEYVFDGEGFEVGAYADDYWSSGGEHTRINIAFTSLFEINTEILDLQSYFSGEIGNNLWNMIGKGFYDLAIGADSKFWEGVDPPPMQKTHYIVSGMEKWYRSDEINYIGIGSLYKVNPIIGKIGMKGDIYAWKLWEYREQPSANVLFWANYAHDYQTKK